MVRAYGASGQVFERNGELPRIEGEYARRFGDLPQKLKELCPPDLTVLEVSGKICMIKILDGGFIAEPDEPEAEACVFVAAFEEHGGGWGERMGVALSSANGIEEVDGVIVGTLTFGMHELEHRDVLLNRWRTLLSDMELRRSMLAGVPL